MLVCFLMGPVAVSSRAATPEELGAEYLFRNWQADISGNRLSLRVSAKVIVYSPRGAEYGLLAVAENSFADFKNARLVVSDTAGHRIREWGKKQLTKACGFGSSGLYDDICTYWSEFEAASFPYLVEYEYEIEYSSLFFWQSAYFQSRVPVREAQYDLTVPTGTTFHHAAYGLESEPEISTEGKRQRFLWRATDLAAVDLPESTPEWTEDFARLAFVADSFALGEYALSGITWQSIGDWYRRMAEDRYLSNEVAVSANAGLETAKGIYDEVTDATRYVSIQIGVGGWQPHAAVMTAERGYGDCKDLTTLLVSRFRQAGLQSYPVLVRTKELGPIDPAFPALGFNHVITMTVAGHDTLWLDPTCTYCQFGDLPTGDEDIMVLVVTDSGGVLSRTPASVPAANSAASEVAIDIAANAHCSINVRTQVQGDPARYLRAALSRQSTEERAAFLARLFDLRVNHCRLDDWRLEGLEDRYAPLTITVRAATTRPLRTLGGKLYVDPFLFSRLPLKIREPLTDRTVPLKLDGIGRTYDSVTVTWPEGMVIDSVVLPESVVQEHATGRFIVRSFATPKSAVVIVERETSAYAVLPEMFESFAAFRDTVVAASGQFVKLYVH
jgi:transglutaminase-like putative cysteine protease